MHGLDLILSKPSQLTVLRTLYHAEEPLTGREIERRTGLSNRATMMALESLVECSAVDREESGAAHWYTINHNNYLLSKALKPAFECEDLFWEDLRKTIRRVVMPRPIGVVATGPLARDDTQSSGLLELTLVFSTSRKRMNSFPSLEELEEVIWDRYAISVDMNMLDVYIMDQPKYRNLWRRVEREGILVFGSLP